MDFGQPGTPTSLQLVGATVIALLPLAAHGGTPGEPLCCAQIGGLTIATFIALLLVPVISAILVLYLKWVKWQTINATEHDTAEIAPLSVPENARAATGGDD